MRKIACLALLALALGGAEEMLHQIADVVETDGRIHRTPDSLFIRQLGFW